jgi:Flp pilus assembly protein TadG
MARNQIVRMMLQSAARLKRLVRETSGNEVMEAAAIFPLLFMMILGIFWFGQAFNMYGTITRAAQEGARAGAAPYCSTCSTSNSPSTNAYNAVQAAMTTSNLNITKAQWLAPAPSVNQCSSGSAQGCDASIGTNVCVQQPIQLTSPAAGVPAVCGIAVSFQYPYKFWLPFSTLNNQQIMLKAQARVRMETQ